MKVLYSENEYRKWFDEDFLQNNRGETSYLSPEEIEKEISRKLPKHFPCLAWGREDLPSEYGEVGGVFSKEVVEKWARMLGLLEG